MGFNPFDLGYFTEDDLSHVGFLHLGKNVRIAKSCNIVGIERIKIGDNVRIDGFTSIIAGATGTVDIGSFVHVGGYCLLSAGENIVLSDFSGLSQGVRIYTRTDDYSGDFLTNPTVPGKYTHVIHGPVTLGKHVIVGSGSVILPNTVIGEGSAVGALTLVSKSIPKWEIHAGSPARRIKSRSDRLLVLERQLCEDMEIGE